MASAEAAASCSERNVVSVGIVEVDRRDAITGRCLRGTRTELGDLVGECRSQVDRLKASVIDDDCSDSRCARWIVRLPSILGRGFPPRAEGYGLRTAASTIGSFTTSQRRALAD